jgi:osmotically-inducible protein OsmY
MADWNRRTDRDLRPEVQRNYEDVEFANNEEERREYERRFGRGPNARDYRSLTDINPESRKRRSRDDADYERMYDTYTRDYVGYGNGSPYGTGRGYRSEPDYQQLYEGGPSRTPQSRRRFRTEGDYGQMYEADRASIRDEGRRTDRSAYNPDEGRDLSPDEFGRGHEDYWRAYGSRGVQSRPVDYYRNRSELYDGRPEARGWRPDEETTSFVSHRGRGPKDYKRSDERIREDINDRMTDDHQLDASGISVTVKDGEVTLSGTVDSKFAKRHAEDIADVVLGVSHVQNNLRVNSAASSVNVVAATEGSATAKVGTEWGSITPGGSTTAQQRGTNNGSNFG